MARSLFVLLALGLIGAPAAGAAPRTLRVDYYHTGNAREERFSLDRVVLEPLEWPGNPERQVPFCRVCQRAISRVIDLYTRRP